jgi:alpha-D-ribose 1-methylphosphonate 5-triphosphate synthase subunit PhnI
MYVAAKGGEEAIQQSEKLYQDLKKPLSAELVDSIQKGMPYLIDRVMGESSLYSPELAALALAQTGGDTYEAVLVLRGYRSTQPRLAYAKAINSEDITCVRRISSAFKDVPGGQILGPSLDYSHRLLRMDVLDGIDNASNDDEELTPSETASPRQYPPITDWQRQQKLLAELPEVDNPEPAELPDITRKPLLFPASRANRLQALARADTGGLLALGYANMRGYGPVHPTINEVRLGYAKVTLKHPVTGVEFSVGQVKISHAEIVQTERSVKHGLGLELGFCGTFGWNEVKNIAGAMLDLAMDRENSHPALSEEFVLYHTEPVESSGFCIHLKLPHYVTFASSMDSLRDAKKNVETAQQVAASKASDESKKQGDIREVAEKTSLSAAG